MGYVVLLMAAVYLIAYHTAAFVLRLRRRTAAPSKAAGQTVRVRSPSTAY